MGVTGAILSGGMSRRMGVPKAGLLLPDGRSMIETVRDTLRALCNDVVLLGGSFGLEGHRVLEDARADTGPLAGIEVLLASGIDDRYLVVPCDMPQFKPATARRLLDVTDARSSFVAGHPLPCMVEASLHADLVDAIDDGVRAVRAWHERIGSVQIELEGGMDEDVDTPGEFKALWTSLARKGS